MGDADMDALAELRGTDREGAYALAHANVPLRRPAEPHEVATVVAFLLSEEAAYVSGAELPIDGGATEVDVSATAWNAGSAETKRERGRCLGFGGRLAASA